MKNIHVVNQNIYITSDKNGTLEEGDWLLSKEEIIHNEWGWNFGDKKIILTTDADLIKDGVQSIDDDFLKWFVKNPSCDEVEVELVEQIPSGFNFGMNGNDEPPTELVYQIIIPSEEYKQEKTYSEEQVYDLFAQWNAYQQGFPRVDEDEIPNGFMSFNEWFKQFKKK